ncbi:hypothetical protein ACFGVR_14845 [Mucilaginibacter sp. AW1-3]
MKERIETFIVNLPSRKDRKLNILKEFNFKPAFNIHVVEGQQNPNGSLGLWNTLVQIVDIAIKRNLEYFLFCEDDHIFTEMYEKTDIFSFIEVAKIRKGDLLLGGVSYLTTAIELDANLFWIEKFHGLNFCIFFKQIFPSIKNYNFREKDSADIVLSKLSKNKFLIFPYISVQKEFGYSDITQRNATPGKVTMLFRQSAATIDFLSNTSKTLTNISRRWQEPLNWPNIPIYVLNDCEANQESYREMMRENGLDYRPSKIDSIRPKMSDWKKIQLIIAESKTEDVIIISNLNHQFTTDYDKEYLKRTIKQAFTKNIDIISGGDFYSNHHIIPISDELYWVNSFSSSQFLIVLKSAFSKILASKNDFRDLAEAITVTDLQSCIVFPFISTIKSMKASPTSLDANHQYFAEQSFKRSSERFEMIRSAYSFTA